MRMCRVCVAVVSRVAGARSGLGHGGRTSAMRMHTITRHKIGPGHATVFAAHRHVWRFRLIAVTHLE